MSPKKNQNLGYACCDRYAEKDGRAIIWEGNYWDDDDVHDCGEIDWETMNIVVKKISALLLKYCEPKDRIAVLFPRLVQLPMTIVAAIRVGVVPIIVDPLTSPENLAQLIQELAPKAIITVDGFFQAQKLHKVMENVNSALKLCQNPCQKVIVLRHVAPNDGVPPPSVNLNLDETRDVEWSAEFLKIDDDVKTDEYKFKGSDVVAILPKLGEEKHFEVFYSDLRHELEITQRILEIDDEDDDEITDNILVLDNPTTLESLTNMMTPWFGGRTLILYEGPLDYPDPSRLSQIVLKHQATSLAAAEIPEERLDPEYLSLFNVENLRRIFGSSASHFQQAYPNVHVLRK
ncbi:unnamed protein product [Caenorhabditis auriculariae]|uniref:acetate--CoA ligase n=1 Tax=Caenorhabditis auriculariae TaxID=2777116 RepID=A0A8S1GTF0_9PELO|nr:unnamed protein product [Caenorhabditis auriculariae]